MQPVNVLIPTLDAAESLPACLGALAMRGEVLVLERLVVADGGSRDRTRDIARAAGAEVLALSPGRGHQLAEAMDHLAAQGAGWVLVLHADTRLEEGWAAAVAAFLECHPEGGGAACFTLAFDEDRPAARRTARLANWRSRRLGLPYGDQGLLVHMADYRAAGGYPREPLMEDVALARRLARHLGRGWLTLLPARAFTSAMRYRRDGWWRRPIRNLTILALYFLGVPPARLAGFYGRQRPDREERPCSGSS